MIRRNYLVIVILVSVFIRAIYLDVIPIWDWDEGANLDIAIHLSEGRQQWFALTFPFIPHPPLYFIVSVFFLKLFGASILALRIESLIFSTLTVVLVYLIAARLFDERHGLIAGLFYAVYPPLVFWNRTAMINNLLILLYCVSMYAYLRFTQEGSRRFLYFSSLFAGLCIVTGLVGVPCVLALIYLTFRYHRHYLFHVIIICSIPALVFIAYELYVMPEFFIKEVFFQSTRFNLSVKPLIALGVLYWLWPHVKGPVYVWYDSIREPLTLVPPVGYLALSLLALVKLKIPPQGYYPGFADYLTFLFCVGFIVKPVFLIEDDRNRSFLVSFFSAFFIFLIFMDRADHMTMVLYPLFVLLAVNFIEKVFILVKEFLNSRKMRYALLTALVIAYHPLFVSAAYSGGMVFGNLMSQMDVGSVQRVSAEINYYTNPDSVVIGYSWLTHLVNSDFCVVGQAIAYEGETYVYYSGDYPLHRFAFNCSYKNADIILLSEDTILYLSTLPQSRILLEDLKSWENQNVDSFIMFFNPDKYF